MSIASRKFIVLMILSLIFLIGCPGEKGDEAADGDSDATTVPTGIDEGPAEETVEEMIARARTIARNAHSPEAVLEAKPILISALTRDRENAAAYAELALIEMKAGGVSGNEELSRTRLANANKLAVRAVKLDPNLADAHHIYARVQTYLGFYDRAEEEIAEAESLGLDAGEVAATRSLIAARQGDSAAALRLAEQTIESEDTPRYARIEMATIAVQLLWDANLDQEALTMAKRAVEIAPDSAMPKVWEALSLLRLKQAAEAIGSAERAMSIDPAESSRVALIAAYSSRIEELHNRGNRSEMMKVISSFEKHFEGDDAEMKTVLGKSWLIMEERTGDRQFRERAKRALDRALELDPGAEEASALLAEMNRI